jgi:hypothetical protein
MSLASVFNTLGQSVIPQVAAAVFPDTCTIKGESLGSDSGGGQVSTVTDDYTNVPCAYEPLSGQRFDSAGKLLSTQAYRVTIATHYNGSRINLDPKEHKFVVNSRGNEPAKTFRIESIGDDMGVVFEVLCTREN